MSRNPKLGIWLMIAAVAAFATQDGFSRYLAGEYNTLMVVMVRYWVFAGFVMLLALRRPEGVRAAVGSRHMRVHVARSVLLVGEICVIVWGYTLIGLIESHAVFAICPLLIAAFSGLILGERILWQRWLAIGAGMLGVVVIYWLEFFPQWGDMKRFMAFAALVVIGYKGPEIYLSNISGKRTKAIQKGLPDALDLLVGTPGD